MILVLSVSPPHPPLTHSLPPSLLPSIPPSFLPILLPSPSHPVSSNGEGFSRVQVLPPIKDWFLLAKVLLVSVDQSLYNLAIHSARTLVRGDCDVIMVERAVWNFDLHT